MNLEKIYEYQTKLEQDLSFEEISKLYREILYTRYKDLRESDSIHCYQLLCSVIDIFIQMLHGIKFEYGYLKNTIKWKL